MSFFVRILSVVMASGFGWVALAADDATLAKEVLQTAGVSGGLCIHLGCGRTESPGLTAALAENSAMAVHGLALDDAALARARKEIEARGMAGRATVEKVELKPLPYLPDLATLAVVEDLGALQGVTKEDILRVVAPYGVLCVKEGGKWTKTVKPRPKEMDAGATSSTARTTTWCPTTRR